MGIGGMLPYAWVKHERQTEKCNNIVDAMILLSLSFQL